MEIVWAIKEDPECCFVYWTMYTEAWGKWEIHIG